MKKRVEAVDLLKRSYAQMKEAAKDKEGEDDIVVVKLREQYKIWSKNSIIPLVPSSPNDALKILIIT